MGLGSDTRRAELQRGLVSEHKRNSLSRCYGSVFFIMKTENETIEECLSEMSRDEAFNKQTEMDKHFGRLCVIDKVKGTGDYESERCAHCRFQGERFIVNGYVHFHCNHPDEKWAGEPGWASLRDIAEEGCAAFDSVSNAEYSQNTEH